jgi:hypothetical protein
VVKYQLTNKEQENYKTIIKIMKEIKDITVDVE